MPIPIIDVFAGPGGLAEGFSSVLDQNNERVFDVKLSIEKDPIAYQTLKLRSFYRQFPINEAPEEYYRFVRGEMTVEQLYKLYPDQAVNASNEAWCATLGVPNKNDENGVSHSEVDQRILAALNGERDWVLIGGPPCQAYSLAGRARRQELTLNEETDNRVGLYKEYLRIIAAHNPAVFVMENVKGILSAKTESKNIFNQILKDLKNPLSACWDENIFPNNAEHVSYKIYSLVTKPHGVDKDNNPLFKPQDFIIKAEDYGVPQKRHRVILLGIREDVNINFHPLVKQNQISLISIIGQLPQIRSGITRSFSHSEIAYDQNEKPKKRRIYQAMTDSAENWQKNIKTFNEQIDQYLPPTDMPIQLPENLGTEFYPTLNYQLDGIHSLSNWFFDLRLGGILQHSSRKHLLEDIKRYLFAARFTQIKGTFPRMSDYNQGIENLMPDHENSESGKFTDRFRVQLPGIPATTVTSHISKDGHYFIHYDPQQSRSLTVREAARIQTFPDNYYFCGGRTQQFHQVGNAVPPYLAFQIAEKVADIFDQFLAHNVGELEEVNG